MLRRTPMPARRTRMRRSKALPEQPTKRHPTPKGPSVETTRLVTARDGWRCVVCGALLAGGSRSWDWSLHHRRGRDGRPDSHSPANLILVCGASNVDGCHGRVHRNRGRESRVNGWLVSRIAAGGGLVPDPSQIPVLVDGGSRWVLLTHTGGYAETLGGAA